MDKKRMKKLGWLLCALMLAVIVGCQSVGGFGLDNMLLKQLDVSKQESSQVLEVEIDVNEASLEGEEPELVKAVELFSKFKVNISHSKTDDAGKQWATGVLSFGKGDVPFTMHTDAKAVRIDVDGAKRPLVIQIPDFGEEFGAELEAELDINAELQKTLMDSVRELAKSVASYFVKGLPNPPVITVDQVTEPIRGTETKLTKVHAELNGEQLGELIPVYLNNLVQDEEGFKDVVRNVFKWVTELPPEIKTVFGADEVFEGTNPDEVADVIVETLFPELASAQEELKEFTQTDEWKEIFDKGITLTTDLYVDDSLHLRKSFVELTIAPKAFEAESSLVRSIKIRSSGENWNVNGEVDVPDVQTTPYAVDEEELSEITAYRFVRLFEEDSLLYDLFKNDLNIDDQRFELSDEWGMPFLVDDGGAAYVPVRHTLEEMEIRLGVPSKRGEIRFYDESTGQAIVFQRDSDKATVNGKEITLKHPVAVEYGAAYASADDLFGLLGAEFELADGEDGERLLKVSRDR